MSIENPNSLEESGSIKVEKISQIKEHIGEVFESEPILISEDSIKKFVELAGDSNPIHFNSEEMGRSVLNQSGNEKIVVPGDLIYILTKSSKTLYKALQINEPVETISKELDNMKWLKPTFVDQNVIYEYKLEKAEDIEVKSRKAVQVTFNITVYKIEDDKKIRCMKCDYTPIYVTLNS